MAIYYNVNKTRAEIHVHVVLVQKNIT